MLDADGHTFSPALRAQEKEVAELHARLPVLAAEGVAEARELRKEREHSPVNAGSGYWDVLLFATAHRRIVVSDRVVRKIVHRVAP